MQEQNEKMTDQEKMNFFVQLFEKYSDIIKNAMTEEDKKLYLEKKND